MYSKNESVRVDGDIQSSTCIDIEPSEGPKYVKSIKTDKNSSFETYCRHGFNPILFSLLVLISLIIWIIRLVSYSYLNVPISIGLAIYLSFNIGSAALLLSYHHLKCQNTIRSSLLQYIYPMLTNHINIIESCYIISGTLSSCLYALNSSLYSTQNQESCISDFIFLIISPLIYYITTSTPTVYSTVCSWCISFAFSMGCLQYIPGRASIIFYHLFILVAILTIYIQKVQVYDKFHTLLLHQKVSSRFRDIHESPSSDNHILHHDNILCTSIRPSIVLSESKYQSDVLKQIISNVSHDMISPLQALEMGLESLHMMLVDHLHQYITTTTTTPSYRSSQASSSTQLNLSYRPSPSHHNNTTTAHITTNSNMMNSPSSSHHTNITTQHPNSHKKYDFLSNKSSVTGSFKEYLDIYSQKYDTRHSILPPKDTIDTNIHSLMSPLSTSGQHPVTSASPTPHSSQQHSTSAYHHPPIIPMIPANTTPYMTTTFDTIALYEYEQQQLEIVQTMRSTLFFMTMIIDRSLDASKCTGGVQLIPNLEMFDAKESINKVIRCVTGLQSMVPINVIYYPNHPTILITTDKKWFEGNFLCVLSNAVKFSQKLPEVPIEVKVTLFNHTIIPPLDHSHPLELKTDDLDTIASQTLHQVNSMNNKGLPDMKHTLRIDVIDSGSPIDESHLLTFFHPTEANTRSKVGGMGMGLYTLAKRIEALGGQYEVVNRSDFQHDELSRDKYSYENTDEIVEEKNIHTESGDDQGFLSSGIVSNQTPPPKLVSSPVQGEDISGLIVSYDFPLLDCFVPLTSAVSTTTPSENTLHKTMNDAMTVKTAGTSLNNNYDSNSNKGCQQNDAVFHALNPSNSITTTHNNATTTTTAMSGTSIRNGHITVPESNIIQSNTQLLTISSKTLHSIYELSTSDNVSNLSSKANSPGKSLSLHIPFSNTTSAGYNITQPNSEKSVNTTNMGGSGGGGYPYQLNGNFSENDLSTPPSPTRLRFMSADQPSYLLHTPLGSTSGTTLLTSPANILTDDPITESSKSRNVSPTPPLMRHTSSIYRMNNSSSYTHNTADTISVSTKMKSSKNPSGHNITSNTQIKSPAPRPSSRARRTSIENLMQSHAIQNFIPTDMSDRSTKTPLYSSQTLWLNKDIVKLKIERATSGGSTITMNNNNNNSSSNKSNDMSGEMLAYSPESLSSNTFIYPVSSKVSQSMRSNISLNSNSGHGGNNMYAPSPTHAVAPWINTARSPSLRNSPTHMEPSIPYSTTYNMSDRNNNYGNTYGNSNPNSPSPTRSIERAITTSSTINTVSSTVTDSSGKHKRLSGNTIQRKPRYSAPFPPLTENSSSMTLNEEFNITTSASLKQRREGVNNIASTSISQPIQETSERSTSDGEAVIVNPYSNKADLDTYYNDQHIEDSTTSHDMNDNLSTNNIGNTEVTCESKNVQNLKIDSTSNSIDTLNSNHVSTPIANSRDYDLQYIEPTSTSNSNSNRKYSPTHPSPLITNTITPISRMSINNNRLSNETTSSNSNSYKPTTLLQTSEDNTNIQSRMMTPVAGRISPTSNVFSFHNIPVPSTPSTTVSVPVPLPSQKLQVHTLPPPPQYDIPSNYTQRSSGGGSSSSRRGLKLSVLVVDDSLPIVKMTQMSLEKAGHTVNSAKNGKLGLQLMKQRVYDLVLMDIQMPVMGGIEAVTLFRQFEQECLNLNLTPNSLKSNPNESTERDLNITTSSNSISNDNISRIKDTMKDNTSNNNIGIHSRMRRQFIIGMSANGEVETREAALKSGMDAFLNKPFSLEAIMKVILENLSDNDSLTHNSGGGLDE